MYRNFIVRIAADVGHALIVRLVNRIALRRKRQIGDRLCQRQLALRGAKTFLSIPGLQGNLERPRVGITDVFTGNTNQAPGDIQRVATSVEHPAQPVK